MTPITTLDDMRDELSHNLKIDEGVCYGFYLCPRNRLTCGIGHNMEAQFLGKDNAIKWIKEGMTEKEVQDVFENDLKAIDKRLDFFYGQYSWFQELERPRKIGFYNMAFQMGVNAQSKFKRSLQLMQRGKFEGILFQELQDSLWFKQTPNRANRVATMIAYGYPHPYYKDASPRVIKPTLVRRS